MTNRDKFNGMSNEELSELLSNMPCSYCSAYDYCHDKSEFADSEFTCDELIKKWLESEAEE